MGGSNNPIRSLLQFWALTSKHGVTSVNMPKVSHIGVRYIKIMFRTTDSFKDLPWNRIGGTVKIHCPSIWFIAISLVLQEMVEVRIHYSFV